MSQKRRQSTEEFKESAVKQGYRLSEASRNLSVNVSVLRRWEKAMETGNDQKPLVAVGRNRKIFRPNGLG